MSYICDGVVISAITFPLRKTSKAEETIAWQWRERSDGFSEL